MAVTVLLFQTITVQPVDFVVTSEHLQYMLLCCNFSHDHVHTGQVVESDGSEEAAEAVENLLESYFMQIDGTYDRLVSICKLPLLITAYLHLFWVVAASCFCLSQHVNALPGSARMGLPGDC